MTTLDHDLRAAIRTIPDYPKPGIMFRDITTLLGNARAFRRAVDELVQPWAGSKIDKVAGMEARGFILGGAVAHQVSAGFIPIRKKGKLPHKRVSIAYSLEYGLDEMEMHEDAVTKGEKVILVDDLIATGGTAEGAVKLLRQQGADVLAVQTAEPPLAKPAPPRPVTTNEPPTARLLPTAGVTLTSTHPLPPLGPPPGPRVSPGVWPKGPRELLAAAPRHPNLTVEPPLAPPPRRPAVPRTYAEPPIRPRWPDPSMIGKPAPFAPTVAKPPPILLELPPIVPPPDAK